MRKPVTLEEELIFKTIDEVRELSDTMGMRVFIVGGFVRDELMKVPHTIDSDIDMISEGYHGLYLAGLVSATLGTELGFYHRSGTAYTVTNDGLKLEFQANKPKYEVLKELRKMDIPQNFLGLNVIERDFTINSLLQSIQTWKIYDLTRKGVSDLKEGILRCPINPNVLIPSNPIIILRAVMFENRLGFIIQPDILEAMQVHKSLLTTNLTPERIGIAFYKIVRPDPQNGWRLLDKYDLIDGIMPSFLEDYVGKEIPKEVVID